MLSGSSLRSFWSDPDRRRAGLLSGALHLLLLLLLILFYRAPSVEPPTTYLVIDIGVPALSETLVEAPTVSDPAPTTERPQVADIEVGQPQAASTPQPLPAAPEVAPQTAQPEQPAPAPTPPDAVAEEVPRQVLPLPTAVAPPSTSAPELPAAEQAATPLPEIEVPQLEARPLAEAILVPMPAAAVVVPEAVAVAPVPQVTVAAAVTLPVPDTQVQVQAAAPVPLPLAEAQVEEARPVVLPETQVSVAGARDVQVAPQVVVTAPQRVPVPQVQAVVAATTPAVAAPAVDAELAAGATDTLSTQQAAANPGGDAANPGQTGEPDPAATAEGLGAAAGPDGSLNPTGSPAQPRAPFSQQLERPLAVLVDNLNGYPQSGLRPASTIIEMPVEGGISRLMLVFDRTDPERVGPVRSAREYFVELSERMQAVLVHDGGSPGALAAIAQSPGPISINAYSSGDLFSRGDGVAPYNLFSGGQALRAAVNRLSLPRGRLISGTIYRPNEERDEVSEVELSFGGTYRTGFRFEPSLNAYRWVRNGTAAVDAAGEAVMVDAVLIGAVEARPFPNDSAGRLSIPIRGGEATLFLRGRAVQGWWEAVDGAGVRFRTDEAELVDLTPFKTWVVLSPNYGALRTTAP